MCTDEWPLGACVRDSCLFSNVPLPVAPVEWPRPNPCWGWRSAVRWNLRSLPDLTPYFCRGSVGNSTSVLQTACHEHKAPWQKKVSAPLRCPWISESFPAGMDVLGGHGSGKYTSIRGSSLQFMNFHSCSSSLITFLWEVWHIDVPSSSKEIQLLTVFQRFSWDLSVPRLLKVAAGHLLVVVKVLRLQNLSI